MEVLSENNQPKAPSAPVPLAAGLWHSWALLFAGGDAGEQTSFCRASKSAHWADAQRIPKQLGEALENVTQPRSQTPGKSCCRRLGRVLTSLFPWDGSAASMGKKNPVLPSSTAWGGSEWGNIPQWMATLKCRLKKGKTERKGEITAGLCQSLVQARTRMRHSQPDYHKELVTLNNEAHWLAQRWWQIKQEKYDLEIAALNLQCSRLTGFKPRDFRP